MTMIRTKYSTLTINTDAILKSIDKNEIERRREAAKLGAKRMRKNISSKSKSSPNAYPAKMSGTLYKSIGFRLVPNDTVAMIGSKDSKVHLLEFGHGDGKSRNKRPFITKSLLEVEDEMIAIMSRRYW